MGRIEKRELTELLFINKRMKHLKSQMDKIIETKEEDNKENKKKMINIREELKEENETKKKPPSYEDLEDFVLKHFDYVGVLVDFIEEHKEYLTTLYESDFNELKEFSDENMSYLDSIYHKDNFEN